MLVGIDARDALFSKARLHYAVITHATVDQADFTDSDLFWADFHAAHGDRVNWVGAKLDTVRPIDQERIAAELWKAGEPPKWTL